MEDQTSRGQVLKLTETKARLRFPHLVVASLGAIREDKPGRVVTAQVLFDGTNGIYVNRRTRIRDQERSPIAADLKRLMREKSQRGRRTFAITADVAEALRQVPINPRDWHVLECQVEPGGAVCVHAVGTFGVASASYCWSRGRSAVSRSAVPEAKRTRGMFWLLTTSTLRPEVPSITPHSFSFVVCVIAGVPLSWPKTAGGDVVSWVGFELLHSSYQLGISERRAAWFVKWTRTTAEQETVHMGKFEEGLGRVMFGPVHWSMNALSWLHCTCS